ncbi:MAG: chemotaxis protein CheW [Deferrisomatales bacterium]|nr:chemotaxis protein CheW [Deferrisomatales bacterium]
MSESLQVLCFQVGERVFAVDIMGIREILRSHVVTPVPNAPAEVAGVVNLRGQLLPVVNLHQALLHDANAGAREEAKLVVARAAGRTAGVQVDQVLEVVSVDVTELSPVPGSSTGGGGAVVAAFRRELDGRGPVVVLLLRLAILLEKLGIDAPGGRP